MRNLLAAALASLVIAPTAIAAAPLEPGGAAADNHSCASGYILDDLALASGYVDDWSYRHYYFHYDIHSDDDLTTTYVLYPGVDGIHLQTTLSDADLYIYNWDPWTCVGSFVCSSINIGGLPDACTVDTGYWNVIVVQYYSGGLVGNAGHADYTLAVVAG